MRLLRKMRRQDAVYWRPGPEDNFGQRTYASPEEIKVRWEDVQQEFIDAAGNTQVSKSIVYVGALDDDAEVEPLGVLFLGTIEDLVAGSDVNPFLNQEAFEVRAFSKIPTLDANDFLRTATL